MTKPLAFLIFLTISFYCIAQNNSQNALYNYRIPLNKLFDSLKLDKNKASLKVSKRNYLLSVLVNNRIIKTYPIVLGSNPIDDKLQQGDRCTPEGIFKIKAKYLHASWSKFIWFDYPNAASKIKHVDAKKKKQIPANASIGGELGIHGVPNGSDAAIDQKQNWTWGCISLKNKDVNELYNIVFVGMQLEIEK